MKPLQNNAETELIERFFLRPSSGGEIIKGIGDDAAVIQAPDGQQLVLSMDTLAVGTHFTADVDPADLGYKALAVNLSDLAAMAAEPRWLTLSLSLPEADPDWLRRFSEGLFLLADEYGMHLIGGDLVRGGLSVTIQAHGLVPAGAAVPRGGAKPGESVWVSGLLGAAGWALRNEGSEETRRSHEHNRLRRPCPRVELGLALRGVASGMIDLSDGLAGDLGHVLRRSGVNGVGGAEIDLRQLPLSPALRQLPAEQAWEMALTAGEDYELCFTLPPEREQELESSRDCPLTRIGRITASGGLRLQGDKGLFSLASGGYQHF